MVMELLPLPGDLEPDLGHAPGQEEDPGTVQPIPQSEERGLTAAQLRRASQGQSQAQQRSQGQDHDSCGY
jgi:hypothetical protein